MFLCTKCFTVFNKYTEHKPRYYETDKYNPCLINGCIGDVVEVDENIVYAIRELNIKGYPTEFCCSSHIGNHSAYISFRNDRCKVDIASIPLPVGWESDEVLYGKKLPREGVVIIRHIFPHVRTMSYLENQKEINLAMDNLIDWVISLPNLNLGEER